VSQIEGTPPGRSTYERSFLFGERVALRGVLRMDMNLYRGWLDDSEITHFLEMGFRPTSDHDLETVFKLSTETHDNIVFTITDKQSGQAVGFVGLYAINWVCRRGDYRIIIGERESLGRGLGTEVAKLVVAYGFETLNLEVMTLGVNSENHRAIQSYENAGFVREGVRRKMIYRNNRYYDILQMSVLRDEYYANKPGSPA